MIRDTKSLKASLYKPTTSLTGNESPSVYRGANLILRGGAENPYFECFEGNKDLAENYNLADFALAGTLAFTADSFTVTGTGTTFTTQLHLGQHILAGTQVLQVKEVISDTSFLCGRAPDTTETGKTGYRLPQLFEIDGKRGVMLTGNALELGKGHKIAVGSGTLYINGAVLPGTSLVATNKPKAAIFRPATNDFVVREMGYAGAPPLPVMTMITGGTKKMTDLNKHSFMFSYWSGSPEGTDGYSNPSIALKLDGSGNPIQINGANNKFRADFTTSLVGMPTHSKGFVIWGSRAGAKTRTVAGATLSVTSPNETLYENGPWFKIAEVLTSSLLTGDLYEFEYLDGDTYGEVSGDNFAPPASEFVAKIDGRPMYISCYGKRTTADNEGGNPGPACAVSKFDNPDAAPPEWTAFVGGTILGWFEGVGRWFMMTSNGLEYVVATGLYGQSSQGGTQVELPIVSRPYWKTGAANRYSIIIVDDTLYGRSGGKFFKSVGSGDENVRKYDFGGVVEDITRDWSDGYVLTANDPKNTQICFFHSAAYKNSSGYWVSEVLPYSLFNNAWLPKIVLSSTTRDMIVSGVATVDEKLEFLCGGRVAGGTFQSKTYRFAAGEDGLTAMPYYLIWQISDDGLENVSKQIHSIRPTGKFTSMNVQIHGARPGEKISPTNMENGAATDSGTYFSGNIPFANSVLVTRYQQKDVRIKNLSVYALRLSGTWDGVGIKDRLEELVIELSQHGRPR